MKTHRTDTISLVFGLIFVMVASGFLLDSYREIQLPEVGWFVAGGLILIGVVVAIGALVPEKKLEEPPPAPTDEATQP